MSRRRTDKEFVSVRLTCDGRGSHPEIKFGSVKIHRSSGTVFFELDDDVAEHAVTSAAEGILAGGMEFGDPHRVRNLRCPYPGCGKRYSVNLERIEASAPELLERGSHRVNLADLLD